MEQHNILIIDDEREVCMLLEKFLSRKSQTVAFSTSLSEGTEKFKAISPDLLILDHNMPDGYGIEKISMFKALNPKLKVVIISAMSNLRQEALEKGADHFIEKPISFSALTAIISEK
ncbi:MAG: response regulator [Bacteroidia bacterium]